MKVTILACTPNMTEVVTSAAKGCYSQLSSDNIMLNTAMNAAATTSFINGIINSGHLSVLEHASFTFSIEGISRACSHQLVRHRVASYSQQSQRYVEFSREDSSGLINDDLFVVPPAINVGLRWEYLTACNTALDSYTSLVKKLKDNGYTNEQAQEDARYLLPNAAKTNITVTMNVRELRHFFEQRMCKRAQWEIRELATEMLFLCKVTAPVLFQKTGAPCSWDKCREGKHSCGDPYKAE